jgi:hypothetical protein
MDLAKTIRIEVCKCLFCGDPKAEVQRVRAPAGVEGGPILRISCRKCRPVDGRFYEILLADAAAIDRSWDRKQKDTMSGLLRSWSPDRFRSEPQPIVLAYDGEQNSLRVARPTRH